MNYFDDPQHARLRQHYVEGREGGVLLAFTEAWMTSHLPQDKPGKDAPQLDVWLIDREDNDKPYLTNMWAAYDLASSGDGPQVMDVDWQTITVCTLSDYLYATHHCPCHRKDDAARAGASVPEDDDETYCSGDRFWIDRIVWRDMPDLILYSESRTVEELEEELNATLPPAPDAG